MKKDFIVLSLYEVHNASAALMINGEVVAAALEERFSRLKGDHGFPLRAARFCLQQAGVDPRDVDSVVYLNESFGPDGVANILFKRAATYGIEDWIFENENYWHPKLVEKKPVDSFFKVMGGWDRVRSHYYDLSKLNMEASSQEVAATFNEIRREAVERLLHIPRDRVTFAPHYICHHYHAYYSSHMRGNDVVVMHLEGDGGKFNSAVSRPTPEGLRFIGGSHESDIGRIYQWITLLLGMKPYHHEYKVMGLAPYATEHEVSKSYKVLENLFKLDVQQLALVYKQRPQDLYYSFQKSFQGHRFDGIAGALQRMVEVNLLDWAQLVLKKTGAKKICYGGGVAMNVKANMVLSHLEGLEELFVPLSPADESNIFGAAYWVTEQHLIRNQANTENIPPLRTAYQGPTYTREEALKAMEVRNVKGRFHVTTDVSAPKVADLLSKGWTVATCQGRSEFGQRALGNRSILAHPAQPGIVEKINKQIKYRDFWMPFCPTIREEDQHEYLENPKNLRSEHMTIGFAVKKTVQGQIPGVIHSGDGSARPQILKREANPQFHDILTTFKERTGLGVLLNTSFNLHGEPMVDSPDDALHTFERSELDGVWIGDLLVSRHPVP